MQQTLWSFSVLGFRVQVHATFLLLAILVPWSLGLVAPLAVLLAIPMVLASIVVHELGHALTARQFGLRTGDIVLHGIGGHVPVHGVTSPGRQVAISLAGPFAGLALGVTTWMAAALLLPLSISWLGELLVATVWVNVVWSLFNLLPILPLDGGNALRSGLRLVTSDHTALRISAASTMAFGVVGAVLAVQWGAAILAFFAVYVTWLGYRSWPG